MWCSLSAAKGVSKSLEFLNWEFHFWSKFFKESITRDSHLLGINATGLTLSEDPMTMRRSTSFLSYFMARWNCSGRFSPKNTMSGFMMASGSSGGQRGQRGTTCTQHPVTAQLCLGKPTCPTAHQCPMALRQFQWYFLISVLCGCTSNYTSYSCQQQVLREISYSRNKEGETRQVYTTSQSPAVMLNTNWSHLPFDRNGFILV